MKIKIVLGIIIISFIVSLTLKDAFAIASWARKYGADCTMCHWNVNKLNKTGQDFLRRGHMMANEEAGKFKLSDYASLTAKVRFNAEDSKLASFEQHAFSLYTGGALDKGFSYFAEMYFHENSGSNSGTSDFSDYGRSKLAEAFIQYTYGGEETYFTTRFGQILSQLLYIHGTGGRLGKDRSMILTSGIGNNPYRPFQRNYGIELSQRVQSFNASLGVINGTGASPFNVVDNNPFKDIYFTADYEFDANGSIFGVYGYNGQYPMSGWDDNYWQAGPMFNYLTDKFIVTGVLLSGTNTKNKSLDKQYSRSCYIELGYKLVEDKLTPYVRYDYFNSDINSNTENKGAVLGMVWRPYTYGRFVGEYTLTHAASTNKDTNKFSIEAQYMF
jgi:hypothetical protein